MHVLFAVFIQKLEIKRIWKGERCKPDKNYNNCKEMQAKKLFAVTDSRVVTNRLLNAHLTKKGMSSVVQLQTTAASWSYKSPTQATLLRTLSKTSSEMCPVKQWIKALIGINFRMKFINFLDRILDSHRLTMFQVTQQQIHHSPRTQSCLYFSSLKKQTTNQCMYYYFQNYPFLCLLIIIITTKRTVL
jgi:hypothetical protein